MQIVFFFSGKRQTTYAIHQDERNKTQRHFVRRTSFGFANRFTNDLSCTPKKQQIAATKVFRDRHTDSRSRHDNICENQILCVLLQNNARQITAACV